MYTAWTLPNSVLKHVPYYCMTLCRWGLNHMQWVFLQILMVVPTSEVGSKETDEKADEVLKLDILDCWTPENHYRWSKSRNV